MLLLLCTSIFISEPPVSAPTPQQIATADVAASKTKADIAEMKLVEQQNQNNWNMLWTALVTGGGLSAFGGWLIKWREGRHKEKMDERSAKAVEDNAAIAFLKQEIGALRDQVRSLQAEHRLMQEEIFFLTARSDESPFPSWAVNTEGVLVTVSAAFERMILHPRGVKRGDIVGKKHSEIWPPDIAQMIAAVDDAARIAENHTAWAEGCVFHESLGPYAVAKTVQRYHDRPIGLAGVAFPMKNKVTVEAKGTP